MIRIPSLIAVYIFLEPVGGSLLLESFQRGLGVEGAKDASTLYEGRKLQEDGLFEASQPLLAETFGGEPGFYHSVASGDPLTDSVVIWTRYTPISTGDVIDLELRMAAVDPSLSLEAHLDLALNPNIFRTIVTVEPASDWVAKLDINGLASGTEYVFAFSDGVRVSDIGTTHTAPEGPVDEFRYAVFSCSNFPRGYFHAYDVASTIENLDLWIHTGDYFYEGRYFHSTPGPRIDPILPKWEIVDLQDYRLRHASYVHGDEGLRNLRRSTPMMASWDDHETTNNSWEFGAENYQPVCPVNRTSDPSEISQARCDQDEGDSGIRFQNAFQAYMEWLPIRYNEGAMGQIEGSFTQTIEWGDLITIVAFDTRTSFRSEDPTVGSGPLNTFVGFAMQNPDYTQYSNESSTEYAALKETERIQRAILEDPQYTMLGDYVGFMEETFASSAGAGKPWQIFSANTMAGPHLIPDPEIIVEAFDDPVLKATVRGYLDEAYPTDSGATLRGVHAMGLTQMTSNRDGFDGFSYERMRWMKIAENVANNMIVLGGDVHDSYAFTLYQDGNVTGKPVAVNLIPPGVTSTGLGGAYLDAFSPVVESVGLENIQTAIQNAAIKQVPGLQFTNYFNRGFFAVSVTPETHTAEYFLFDDEVIQTDFETVRLEGSLTAAFDCFVSLETKASEKGSLVTSESCGAITFQQSRSALFDIPFPHPNTDPSPAVHNCGMKGCSIQASTVESPGNTKCRRRRQM